VAGAQIARHLLSRAQLVTVEPAKITPNAPQSVKPRWNNNATVEEESRLDDIQGHSSIMAISNLHEQASLSQVSARFIAKSIFQVS